VEMITASDKIQSLVDPPVKKAKREKGLMYLLEDVIVGDSSTSSFSDSSVKTTDVKKEMNNYLCLEVQPSDNLLQWWHDHKRHFPFLSCMAKKCLSIPTISVPSERAFSVARYIVNEKRSCLLPENVDILVFLVDNLDVR